MPGPNGIITVKGSFELSDLCEKEFHKMTQTFDMTAKYGEPKEGPERKAPSSTNRPMQDKVIDNELDTKKIRVHIEDPNNSTPNESGTPTA
jgi:hypothetical protein